MAEDSDAVVLIVSEETGAISLAYNANLYYDLATETVRRSLIALLNYQDVLPEEMEDASDEAE
jgi:diadenylate cyclase